jgi:epidermal growth factor receptor substrate 15
MTNNFSPTPAELGVVAQIFAHADPQKLGVLTGDVAVRVFGGAKLAPTVLGEIWNISDEDNKGWLPKKGVAIAVRLIGWAQKGEKITQALVNKPGPLAVIEGITAVSQQTTGMSLPKSPPPAFPLLNTQDKAKFQTMFMKYGPANGLLSGEKARDIFVKSKLSNEQLLKIWNLADTQDRGALDSADFAIGMYFIQGVMTGKISFIPTSLPPGLYQQAGGSANAGSVRSHMTGNSGSFGPVGSTFASQQTGQSQMLQPDYTGMSGSFKSPNLPARPSASVQGNGHAQDWDVTPAEKASADSLFESLDTQKRGYIEGDVAVPFMLKSQLPGEVLAQVWDLADINNDGRLTSDGFAIAMHLIQKKLAGKEVPATLPPSLIPPSARDSAIGASPFSPAHAQTHQQPEPAVDLFSFDDSPPSSAVPPQPANLPESLKAQSTGSFIPGGFPSAPVKRTVEADPFSAPPFHASPHRDFLSDDDGHDTPSPQLHDQSAEIGNLKNQLQ